jgi:hypothetical protein
MPKRLRKPRSQSDDPAQSAFRVLQRVIEISEGETPKPRANVVPLAERRRKNPAAVALGRKGGLKSAEARMKKIDPDERRRIASHAARERWKKAKG